MSIRSALARLTRLVESTPALARAREQAAFLEAFARADPQNAELVAKLTARLGTRRLASLLPERSPDVPDLAGLDLAIADTDTLRAVLSVRLAAWALDTSAPLPAGTLQTATFGRPACLLATPAGDLLFARQVRFTLVDRLVVNGEHVIIDLPDEAADAPIGTVVDAVLSATGKPVRVRRVGPSRLWPAPYWEPSEVPDNAKGSALPD